MATILILGGSGATGRALSRHLLKESDARLVLAGRRLATAEQYAATLNAEFAGGRVAARTVDAADPADLRAALEGVDLLLVAAPTTQYVDNVARAALQARVDYLDIQLGARKLAILRSLGEEIERAGLCFITEAGYHPGLPAVLVRYAAAHLGRLDRAVTAGYLSIRRLPFTEAVDELVEVFRHYDARIFVNGRWAPPGRPYARRVDFEDGVGVRTCYPMFFEELRLLPEMYPTLTEAGFYIAGTHWVADWVITPLVLAGLRVAPRRAARPLGRLLWWGLQAFAQPPYEVRLTVEATGERSGRPARARVTVSHLDGYEITAIPVVAALLQYLDGSARRPGLWMMGALVEPLRLFRDMERMGLRVRTTVA